MLPLHDSSIEYTLGLDISGSTNQNKNYWETVKIIYEKYKITKIIVWNTSAKIINSQELLEIIIKKSGDNGTSIYSFALKLINEKIKDNIILITDGKIDISDVYNTDILFESHNYKINNILCFNLHNGIYDYSVFAPFRRNNINYIYEKNTYSNTELKLEQYISLEDIKLINNIETITIETFHSNFIQIENSIIAQIMGKGNNELKIKLIQLKKRIIKELSDKISNDEDLILKSLEKNKNKTFDSILYEPWQEVIKIACNYGNTGSIIESNINKLISQNPENKID